MNKKLFAGFLSIVSICFLCPPAAYADTGPKPSVVIEFSGLAEEDYYVTLLSKTESTGPYSVSDEEINADSWLVQNDPAQDIAAWQAFRDYQDADGYYFIEYFAKIDASQTFTWGYYPPQEFKILIYFPDHGKFAVSGSYQRYAFHSYYRVDTAGLDLTADAVQLTAEKTYRYQWEIVAFIFRVILTIAVELLVALWFKLRRKTILLFIAGINILTQTLLNLALNAAVAIGYGAAVWYFIMAELLVMLIEAAAYLLYFRRHAGCPLKKWVAPLYALSANLASLAAGLLLALIMPGMF